MNITQSVVKTKTNNCVACHCALSSGTLLRCQPTVNQGRPGRLIVWYSKVISRARDTSDAGKIPIEILFLVGFDANLKNSEGLKAILGIPNGILNE